MARSFGRHGFGTQLFLSRFADPLPDPEDDAASFILIAELRDVTSPQPSPTDCDSTHLQSTLGFKEFLPGFIDGGELTANANFVEENLTTPAPDDEEVDTGLQRLQFFGATSPGERKGRFILSPPLRRGHVTHTAISFRGYVKSAGLPTVPEDGVILSPISIKADGEVVVVLGA